MVASGISLEEQCRIDFCPHNSAAAVGDFGLYCYDDHVVHYQCQCFVIGAFLQTLSAMRSVEYLLFNFVKPQDVNSKVNLCLSENRPETVPVVTENLKSQWGFLSGR